MKNSDKNVNENATENSSVETCEVSKAVLGDDVSIVDLRDELNLPNLTEEGVE